jgi:hypothetical protein
MLEKEGLRALLEMIVPPAAPTIFIYSPVSSSRLAFTCDFIFHTVLNVHYQICTSAGQLSSSPGAKINYSVEKIKDALQILPNQLLFERSISEARPAEFVNEGRKYFFRNYEGYHFDIFSAVFYFVSRYEEWQHYQPDEHGRFEASQSLLFKVHCHLTPLVDQWIIELRDTLKKMFPQIVFPEKEFKVVSTIDVDNLFAYRGKGFLRTAGAFAKDIVKGDFKNLKERIFVLSGWKNDPFDIYEEVSDFCFEKKIPLFYFFLFRNGTKYDRTVHRSSAAYEKVFQILKKNRAVVGLHPSYWSAMSPNLIQQETNALSQKLKEKIQYSRQHYLRFDIRTTPKKLLACGIIADFTMGFATAPGFRAGTSFPFYHYDFAAEKQTELLLIPFCAMDGAFTVYQHQTPEQTYQELHRLATEVKKVAGIFLTVFHERTFSDHLYKGFGTLYKKLLSDLKH